ncbi:MAG: hypothetical protein M3Y30_15150 [Gemmatimonadota bacterium]|nr:hypothetical protein [Gemmatimonadota bacterium]
MYRIGVTTALIALLTMTPRARAQNATNCQLPQDVKGIPAALDAAIGGRADKDPACLRALFLPEARFVPVRTDSTGQHIARIYSVDDYILNKSKMTAAVLDERQVKYSISEFGNVAHLWSTYVLKVDGKQVARGVNSIQAVKTDAGWRVLEVSWQAENAQLQLTKELLPD